MLMNYHIGRLVLSSLCVGVFVVAGIWWCSFCRLQPAKGLGHTGYADCLLAGSGWNPNTVYSTRLLMMDGKPVRNL